MTTIEETLTGTPAERLTARLDRLPMTGILWKMAFLISLGGFFDLYAISLIGALAPGLFRAKIFTATTVSFFGMTGLASFIGAFFAGLFVGTIAFSYVADRFGRRSIFAFSLLWYGVASFIMALQDTPNAINFWRFISAVGLGVELVTIDAYLSELVPKGSRGKAFALLIGTSAVAPPFIYFLSWKLIPIAPFGIAGWR